MTDWDPEAFTKALIADLREHSGQVTSGPMASQRVLILTTTGAKTGQSRVAVVKFTPDGDAYGVAGTSNGAPTDPFWFKNLTTSPIVKVEADGEAFEARATVAQGADRDQLWARHVAAHPEEAETPEKSGRVIPMVRLTPIR